MDILRHDKAPYIVALLVSVLGWHIAQLTDDIRSTRSVLYTIETDVKSRQITALVHNVSKTHSLKQARFSLACLPGQACLMPNTQRLNVYPPNGAMAGIESDPTAVTITATMPADGRIDFGATLSRDGSLPKFVFVPDEENVIDIYVFEGGGIRGFLVENYFSIILISFLLLLALLLLIMGALLRRRPATEEVQEG
jgi:hypothetical protein